MNALFFLALVSTNFARSAPIDWSQQDIYSAEELRESCTAATGKKECNELIKETAKAELSAYESCTRFQGQGNAPKSEELKKANWERLKSCIPIIDGKSFPLNALDTCEMASSPIKQRECMVKIADSSFYQPAMEFCEASAENIDSIIACMMAIKDKSYSKQDILSCAKQNKIACLQSKGKSNNDLRECSQRLAEVQSKIGSLAAANQEKSLKIELQSILKRIQAQETDTGQGISPAK